MAEFLSLHDAVARYVEDGATVAMEGFTHLIPFATGWEVRVAEQLESTPEPSEYELEILCELKARTERAHAGQ